MNFKRNVKINFDGGNLTSDSCLILYSEFMYKAKKWTKERRVVKLEKKEGQICIDYTFVVTNMISHSEAVLKFYCNSGITDNFVKKIEIITLSGKVVKSSKYLKFKLCSSCAYQNEFWHILKNINSLPYF